MEKIVLYIPNLESQIMKNKRFREYVMQLSAATRSPNRDIKFAYEERKLYFGTIASGKTQLHLVSFDFIRNRLSFRKKEGATGDVNREVYELLSSSDVDFMPHQMSFVMERPPKQTTTVPK
ncbi:hypothetical protein MKY34_21485 [Sporosarcina sp. FSL K6-1522]|uniref:hypothetical protein n=1 Tax=Sporosarcina sp. FSL K6-1522 TaxID=2921554 RepID=UPI00315B2763